MLWTMVALAQDELPVDPVPEPEEEELAPPSSGPPAVTRVMPKYPAVRPDADVRCNVALQVDPQGVPRVMGVNGCDEPFAGAAKAAFEQWRWAPDPTGFIVTVHAWFRRGSGSMADKLPQDEFLRVLDAHTAMDPERAQGAPCRVRVALNPDGEVLELASNELPTCMLIPADGKPAGKVWKSFEGDQASCAVRATPTDDGLAHVQTSACPPDLFKPTDKLLRAWTWNVLEGTPVWDVEVVYRR